MTQNPYASIGGYGGGDFGLDQRPQRTSALAVASLIFSLLCLSAPIGVILGGAAILLIHASGGRLKGTGLAVAGTVIGLLVTFVWILVLVGVLRVAQVANREFLAPIGSVMTGFEAGDKARARALFPPAVNSAITDEQIAAFREAYRAELGAFRGTPDSLGGLISAYFEVGEQMQAFRGSNDVMPMPATFEKGRALVMLEFDPGAKPTPGGLPLNNIGVLILSSGKEVWLRDPSTVPGPTPRRHRQRPSAPAPAAPSAPAPTPDPKPAAPPGG